MGDKDTSRQAPGCESRCPGKLQYSDRVGRDVAKMIMNTSV